MLVTAQEKEALGYERPEGKRNPAVQRLAMENRKQIFSVVQPYVQRNLGRTVEMTGIDAIYPSSAVAVKYRTVDEPIVASYASVALASDGSVVSEASIALNPIIIEAETVSGLYLMAYRDRIDRMREYLAETYPQFVGMPDGWVRHMGYVDPVFTFQQDGPAEEFEAEKTAILAIYQAFLDDPERTDEEWRDVFESLNAGRPMLIKVTLMLADPSVDLTEEITREIGDDIRSNPLFEGFDSWIFYARGNLMMRDDNHFHQQWLIEADRDRPRWWATQTVNGGTVR